MGTWSGQNSAGVDEICIPHSRISICYSARPIDKSKCRKIKNKLEKGTCPLQKTIGPYYVPGEKNSWELLNQGFIKTVQGPNQTESVHSRNERQKMKLTTIWSVLITNDYFSWWVLENNEFWSFSWMRNFHSASFPFFGSSVLGRSRFHLISSQ